MPLRDELAVLEFLTCDLQVFICPQFDVGKCPDFVALDFRRNEIVMVEVTAGSASGNIRSIIRDRQTRWYGPVRQHFVNWPIAEWPIRFLGFVRQENFF